MSGVHLRKMPLAAQGQWGVGGGSIRCLLHHLSKMVAWDYRGDGKEQTDLTDIKEVESIKQA